MAKRGVDRAFDDADFELDDVRGDDSQNPTGVRLQDYYEPSGTQGRAGKKAPRMNLAIPEDVYDFVRIQSRKEGMTYSEFFCALARWYRKKLGDNNK